MRLISLMASCWASSGMVGLIRATASIRRLDKSTSSKWLRCGSSESGAISDFDNPENNDFVVANQLTVIENGVNKRPDVVVFVNGLPLVVIELKNAADENAPNHHAGFPLFDS
jgi:hypothetical protein